MARRPFIAGNWKMNKGPLEADRLAADLKRALAGQTAVDVAVAPPALSIPIVAQRLQHTGVAVAGQDLHTESNGAHTGMWQARCCARRAASMSSSTLRASSARRRG